MVRSVEQFQNSNLSLTESLDINDTLKASQEQLKDDEIGPVVSGKFSSVSLKYDL